MGKGVGMDAQVISLRGEGPRKQGANDKQHPSSPGDLRLVPFATPTLLSCQLQASLLPQPNPRGIYRASGEEGFD